MRQIPSTYKTEFYLNGEMLFDKNYVNLDWGKGSLVSFNEEDYEIVDIYEVGNDVAKANITLMTEW